MKKGDRVIIKYDPSLYMRGYIDFTPSIGTVVHVFDSGTCRVAMDSGDERVFELIKEEEE